MNNEVVHTQFLMVCNLNCNCYCYIFYTLFRLRVRVAMTQNLHPPVKTTPRQEIAITNHRLAYIMKGKPMQIQKCSDIGYMYII